jgi:hypothetical protein
MVVYAGRASAGPGKTAICALQRGVADLRSLSLIVLVMAARCKKLDELVRIEWTAHPVPQDGVSADQESVWFGRGRTADLPLSGQPRQTLCRPAKTDVTDERNRARRKVQ